MSDGVILESIKCFICGANRGFYTAAGDYSSKREALCRACGASLRNSDVAKVLVSQVCNDEEFALNQILKEFAEIKIYEAQAGGPIHEMLKALPGYVCSEYAETNPNFQFSTTNVRSENIEALSFPDNSFDVVITQDVFEHLRNPHAGFCEIQRVLKPEGIHIFTVPFHHGQPNRSRVKTNDGIDTFILPPVYHGDAFKRRASLVYTDFGENMIDTLYNMNFPTRVTIERLFYKNDEIPLIKDKKSYETYMQFEENNNVLDFFLYNSLVFVSTKKESMETRLEPTGERYLPWLKDPKIHYEHLHRYWLASEMADGKAVLDLASGEGYGSYMLSSRAASVCGIDIDETAVNHASTKYHHKNLTYVQGTILDLPLKDNETFDLIVCFEAIEHIRQHDELMFQVKKHLKPQGLFIVSTPDKHEYSDAAQFANHYHVKELYLSEFKELLESSFSHISIHGQKLVNGSRIYPLSLNPEIISNAFVEKNGNDDDYRFVNEDAFRPEYFIAIASDSPIDTEYSAKLSNLLDVSCSLHSAIQLLDEKFNNYIIDTTSAMQNLETRISELEDLAEQQKKTIAKQESHAENQQLLITMMRGSKAWRVAELFREIVYRRLLRR